MILLSAVKLWSAWLVLARDWARLTNAAALSSGATVTTLFLTAVVFADLSAAAVQVGAWAVEIGALVVLARWEAELSSAS